MFIQRLARRVLGLLGIGLAAGIALAPVAGGEGAAWLS